MAKTKKSKRSKEDLARAAKQVQKVYLDVLTEDEQNTVNNWLVKHYGRPGGTCQAEDEALEPLLDKCEV